jgi:hypothetical protein
VTIHLFHLRQDAIRGYPVGAVRADRRKKTEASLAPGQLAAPAARLRPAATLSPISEKLKLRNPRFGNHVAYHSEGEFRHGRMFEEINHSRVTIFEAASLAVRDSSCSVHPAPKNSHAQPARLGRLRRPFLRKGFRRAEPLQSIGFLHGIERRTRRQIARRQLGNL